MKIVRFVGVFALLVVVLVGTIIIVSWQFEPVDGKLLNEFRARGPAMQFVHTTDDVTKVLGSDKCQNIECQNIKVMKKSLTVDFFFIGCYALLYLSISRLLMKRNCPWARYLGIVAMVAGLGAAVADVRENMAILQVLSQTPNYVQNSVNHIIEAALLKWTFSFVAIALLAIAFQDLESRLARWISISFIVTAVVGFAGLWKHPLFVFSFIPLAIGLLLLAFTAFTRPHELIESRR